MKFFQADQYQEACHDRFAYYQAVVKRLLPEARVEHIGASSVPDAISKGDLDIFIGVDAAELERAVYVLVALGFQEKRDTLRTSELCMLESLTEDVALQVVANGSEFEDFVVFRDKLRAEPLLLKRYNELKQSCAGLPHDEYRGKKARFIE